MKLLVRVAPASKSETFRRCGLQFTRGWVEFDLDEATARRLMAEQILEVRSVDEGNHSEAVLEKVEGEPAPAPAPAKTNKAKAKA